jgi:hypothetical protein
VRSGPSGLRRVGVLMSFSAPYGAVVGRILRAHAAPVGTPWMWTLAYGDHEDRTPTHGYEATRQAAMQAFARSLAQRELTVVTRRC